MCRVQYTMCPEEVDCSGSTPVTGNIQLDLPGKQCSPVYGIHVYTCTMYVPGRVKALNKRHLGQAISSNVERLSSLQWFRMYCHSI